MFKRVCFNCGSEAVIWDNDFDAEDCGYDWVGIISEWHCADCGTDITCYTHLESEDDETERADNTETADDVGTS